MLLLKIFQKKIPNKENIKIYIVPGNHDIDRIKVDRVGRASLDSKFFRTNDEGLNERKNMKYLHLKILVILQNYLPIQEIGLKQKKVFLRILLRLIILRQVLQEQIQLGFQEMIKIKNN